MLVTGCGLAAPRGAHARGGEERLGRVTPARLAGQVNERPRTLCPTCREPIEPDELDVIEAEEIVPTEGFGSPSDTAEGLRVAFHIDCFPEGDPRYRRV